MRKLNLPEYPFTVRRQDNRLFIFDEFRKKWLVLTPEEWVRQHLLMFLTRQKGYPVSLIAIEKQVKVNQLPQRFDAVIYTPNGAPLAIIECKASNVPIDENTINQILRYNAVIQAPLLILSNGINTYCATVNFKEHSFSFLEDIPSYKKE